MLLPLEALFLVAPTLQLSLLLILAQSSVFRRRSMQLFYCFAVPLVLAFLAVLAAVLGIISTSYHTEPARVVLILLDLTLGIGIVQIQFLLSASRKWRFAGLAPLVFAFCAFILAFIPGQRLSSTILQLTFILITFPCTLVFLLCRLPSTQREQVRSPSRSHQVRLVDLTTSPTSSSFSRTSCDKQAKGRLSYDAPVLPVSPLRLPPPPPPTPIGDFQTARPRLNLQGCRDPTISWFSAHSDLDLESGLARGIRGRPWKRFRTLVVNNLRGCSHFLRDMASRVSFGREIRPLTYAARVRMLLAIFAGQVLLSASTMMRMSCIILVNAYHADTSQPGFSKLLVPVLPLPHTGPSTTSDLWVAHILSVLRVVQVVFTVFAICCVLLAYFSYSLCQLRPSSRRPVSIQITTSRMTSSAPPAFNETPYLPSEPNSPPPAYCSPGRRADDYNHMPSTPTPTSTQNYIRPPQRTRNHRSHTVPVLTPVAAPRPVKMDLASVHFPTPSPYSRFADCTLLLPEEAHAHLSPTPERHATIVHMPRHQSHEPIIAGETDQDDVQPSRSSLLVKKKSSLASVRTKRKSMRESFVERSRKASFASFVDALHATQQRDSKTHSTLAPSTMFHSPSCFSRMSLSSRASRRISRSSRSASLPAQSGTDDEAVNALQELFDPSDPFAMTPLPQLRLSSGKGATSGLNLYASALEEEGSSSSCESSQIARTPVKPPAKALQQGRKRVMHAWGRLPLLYSSSSSKESLVHRSGFGSRRKEGKPVRGCHRPTDSMEDSARLAAKLLIRMGEAGKEHADFHAV